MNFWEKMEKVDVRIIFVVVIIAIAIPLVKPLGLPMKVMPMSQQVYDYIEKMPNGSKVFLSFDYGTGSIPELEPAAKAFLTHFFRKGFKVYTMASTADGGMVSQMCMAGFEKLGKVYDKDFITLGYFAGGEAGIAAWSADAKKVFQRDARGTPIDQLAMMKDIKTVKDFTLGVTVNSGPGGYGTVEAWVRQVPIVYKTPFIVAPGGAMVANTIPYIQAGQIQGMIGGLRPSAEYELLLKEPGLGVAAMDAQSAAHSIMIAFILLGNAAYFALRKRPGARQ
jgi:hypothetical protein